MRPPPSPSSRVRSVRPLIRAAIRAYDLSIEHDSARLRKRAAKRCYAYEKRLKALGCPKAMIRDLYSSEAREWAFGENDYAEDDVAGLLLGLVRCPWIDDEDLYDSLPPEYIAPTED